MARLADAAPPEELSTVARINLPSLPDAQDALRGKSFAVIDVYHLGDKRREDELIAPLRALAPVDDTVQSTRTSELLRAHGDPGQPTPSVGDGGWLLNELTDNRLDMLFDVATSGKTAGVNVIELRHLEGELARSTPENGALASIPARYLAFTGGLAPTAELAATVSHHVELVEQVLAPVATSQTYPNFADTRRESGTFWAPETYPRSRFVKAAYDPNDVIRSNHPVPLP